MKTRQGFVSNSSSSSFIVAFPRTPDNTTHVKNILFPAWMEEIELYGDTTSTLDIAKQIWKDIQKQGGSASEKEVREALYGYYDEHMCNLMGGHDIFSQCPKEKDYKTEKEWCDAEDIYWTKHEKEAREFEAREAKKFLEKYKDKFILVVNYADDSVFFTTMEHGDIFRNLAHVRVSNH